MSAAIERRLLCQKVSLLANRQRRGRRAADEEAGPGADEQNPDAAAADDEEQIAEEDGPGRLVGHAAVFYAPDDPGTEYELWHDARERVVERIAPGAFARACREDDCRALFNHDASAVLGRTTSGTLELEEDQKGLRYQVALPDTSLGRDVASLVSRGDISGSSFTFVVEKESWEEIRPEDGGSAVVVRTLQSVRLLDVGPVTYPAYAATSASSASGASPPARDRAGEIAEARASYARWRGRTLPVMARVAAVQARACEVEADSVLHSA